MGHVVRVITGPLYLPHKESDGKKYVTYEVIGDNNVAVPTHFFKVITLEKGPSKEQLAYIMPRLSEKAKGLASDLVRFHVEFTPDQLAILKKSDNGPAGAFEQKHTVSKIISI